MSYCGECHQECKAVKVNVGIGRYEYWGQDCTDNRYEIHSDCCDADAYSNEECTINEDEVTE